MVSPQHGLVCGLVPPHLQEFAHFSLLNFGTFLSIPFSSLSGTLWYFSHSSQSGVICKLAKGTLCPIAQINGDVEEDWTLY